LKRCIKRLIILTSVVGGGEKDISMQTGSAKGNLDNEDARFGECGKRCQGSVFNTSSMIIFI
jgi:hypothetical protein